MIHINTDEGALVDGDTGKLYRPPCFKELVQYINYIEGRGHAANTQNILKTVIAGEKFITKMIAANQARCQT